MYVNFVNMCKRYIGMCGLIMHNAFHMYWGNLRKLGVSARHERNKKDVFLALA